MNGGLKRKEEKVPTMRKKSTSICDKKKHY